jgi:6-phosphogluconolactonase (cycloisomerase 2 family)
MLRLSLQWRARSAAAVLTALAAFAAAPAPAADTALLLLEQKIPLGKVSGRIDHLAIDADRQRLFVAELGNNSVAVVDLRTGNARNISGLKKPQGVAYVKSTDTLYVANAGDGSVQLFQGPDLVASGRIELGDDADNIRVDETGNKVFVGYGNGALAVIDPARRARIADIPLPAHPEGFQIAASGALIFVNLPDVRQIAMIDTQESKVRVTWAINDRQQNFPMAIDEDRERVLVGFRNPATLAAFALRDGSLAGSIESCGDADDLFVDAKRRRIYVSCGEGFIDVFESHAGRYVRMEHIATAAGARTSLFVPELDRLFLAVRATWSEPAAIWVFRPGGEVSQVSHGRDPPRQ